MKTIITVLTLGLAFGAPAAAQTVAIVGGTVATVANPQPIENGTVVIENGRIAAVGPNVPVPAGAQVIDAAGGWVTPGIVAAFSRVGIVEVGAVEGTNDIEADESPYNAAIAVAPAVNPRATNIPVARIEGVTRAAVLPEAGNDIFGGQGAIIHLGQGPDLVTDPAAFQFIQMGENGASLSGGSRAATYVRLADAFREARAYAEDPDGYEFGRSTDSLLTRADAEALVAVIEGEVPAMIHVQRASDINNVLDLKEEYPEMRMVLAGVAEGWMVADRLARENVPVIATPMLNLPASFEVLGSTQANIGRMVDAGVTVAVSEVNDDSAHQIRRLPQQAGQLVAQQDVPGSAGLTRAEALAAITSVPAQILDIDDQVGTLEVGKVADVVVWDGDPIELSSAPTAVFIAGQPIPMQSRQTKLRDRYNPNLQTGLPPQYTRTQ